MAMDSQNGMERKPLADLIDEIRNWPSPLQELESVVAGASDRISAPGFPKENKPAAWEAVRKYILDWGEQHRDHVGKGLTHNLSLALGRLAVQTPPASPAGEIEKCDRAFRELGFRRVEVDNLKLSLKPGERIVEVGVRRIEVAGVKGNRSIDRHGLRAIRPAIIRGEEYIQKWEAQFPNEAELAEIQRRIEAPPQPLWSAE
jgi:hypothetical protein